MWNISAATRLVTGQPVARFLVQEAAPYLPLVRINPEHARTVDLTQPVILVPLPVMEALIPIDGWHRIHRAVQEGVRDLPCQVLTPSQEHTVRLYGPGMRNVPRRYSRG